jgi:hypothetical protein
VHGGKIAKGHLRIGSWNEDVGGYSWFVHLGCWRVPAKVWLAFGPFPSREQIRASMHLMDSVSICGFSGLSPEQQDMFIDHVINSNNWARVPGNMKKPNKLENVATVEGDEATSEFSYGAQAVRTPIPSTQQVRIKNEEAATTSPVLPSAGSALIVQGGTPQKRGGAFIMPIPGQNGALRGAMAGLNVVLTGL